MAVLDSMIEGVDTSENNGCNQNNLLEDLKHIFDYSLLMNDTGTCLK